MQRKYFFFDYDGTLAISRSKTIPASTQECIRLLRAQGHFVGLATGRLQCNAVEYIEEMGIDNIVADGGNSVTIGGELVWMQPLPLDMAKTCLRRLDEAGYLWAVQLANEMVRWTPFSNFDEVSDDYYIPTSVDESLSIDAMQEIYKIYIPATVEETKVIVSKGILDGTPWVRFDSNNIFVEPLKKSVGIKKVLEVLGGREEDVVVFGDGTNDLSMFLPQWTSIAMGNAVQELKDKADYVTTDIEDDGIWNACKHFGFI